MREWIGSRLCLGERNDLANVFLARKQCNQAIDAERETRMRWCAEPERIEQETELALLLGDANAKKFEHTALDIAAMDSHTARAEFPTIEHEVVGLRANLQQVLRIARVEQCNVFGVRHRKWVMGRYRIAGIVE